MITIVNMNSSNMASVINSFKKLGAEITLAETPGEIQNAETLVLPGVGAFKNAMEFLQEKGLTESIREHALTKEQPLLGICLGMQLLADKSYEHGIHDGLGIIRGAVRELKPTDNEHVPNIGWCDTEFLKESVLFLRIQGGTPFYYVHSYWFDAVQSGDSVSWIEFGGRNITTSVQKKNIFGVQFHPEKSQEAGLQLLQNFVDFSKRYNA
ncbi:MAG TPA: imidazole glycerol phosphate synthase subunit HisH [Patescibacteria group bacterium]|nr:imidazole glycerol phosphate synthase subunit HisH [Patescibacteria group bacterium]